MNKTVDIISLPTADKPNHAIVRDERGVTHRTIWGGFLPEDIKVLGREYPEVGAEMIERIAALIPAPRLLEVLIPVELVARFLRQEFSRIKRGIPEGLQLVANPLSVLAFVDGVVKRIITPETEMMHKPAEKLALRTGALEGINRVLSSAFGVQLAYGCSCCALVFRDADREAVLGSDYYYKREQMGRWWDSDVLAANDRLYGPVRVREIPPEFLERSVDFGAEEVVSYERFARVAQMCLDEHPDNIVDIDRWYARAACFIGGQCLKNPDGSCPLPPPRGSGEA